MSKAVFCIVPDYVQALRVVEGLKADGFSADDISVLMPDKSGTRDFAHEQGTKAPEGAVAGAATGGVLGGALGWLVGIGTLAIPGIGPFVAAGPIMAALGGASVGATLGGITGSLIGLGIPEIQAKQYVGKVRGGNVLISVHGETGEEVRRAKETFEEAGAEDVAVGSEVTVKKELRAE